MYSPSCLLPTARPSSSSRSTCFRTSVLPSIAVEWCVSWTQMSCQISGASWAGKVAELLAEIGDLSAGAHTARVDEAWHEPNPTATSRSVYSKQIVTLCNASARQLPTPALPRRLVLAPAQQLRPMPDAPAADVVEGDLDHQLGPQRDPLQLLVALPAARVALPCSPVAYGARCRPARALRAPSARTVADGRSSPAVVVEAQDQRADRALLLARPPAHHDASIVRTRLTFTIPSRSPGR